MVQPTCHAHLERDAACCPTMPVSSLQSRYELINSAGTHSNVGGMSKTLETAYQDKLVALHQVPDTTTCAGLGSRGDHRPFCRYRDIEGTWAIPKMALSIISMVLR